MHSILLLGCGKIGRTIATLLADSGDYHIRAADLNGANIALLGHTPGVEAMILDATDAHALRAASQGCDTVVSALSYRFNPLVAEVAREQRISYFDLTEDIETTRKVRQIAAGAAPGTIFMPQCGLAPGFISILAHHLTKSFDSLDTVHMRVGALPQFPSNSLKYNLTWSTDGLINEYCNPCEAIHDGTLREVLPLEGNELFSLDGIEYEAFNTSGGLGTLCETLAGRVRELNYRTIRYVGHRELAAYLVNDLRLSERRDLLKDILEWALPITFQDVVVIFCNVTGLRESQFVQVSDARKIYPAMAAGRTWSAIQITTACGLCAALDLHLTGDLQVTRFAKQEDLDFDQFIANRFGRYFQMDRPASWNRPPVQWKGADDGAPATHGPRPTARS